MRTTDQETAAQRIPEARYAYYRRCQVFRKGGEQCKAPAEKGSHICYAHAGQLAMGVRRVQERKVVLAEAVAQMRKRGNPQCEMADLFMDLEGINVTIAVMAQALIAGRIDCKTAGRLLVQLQTVSKLLRILHRTKTKNLPLINADNTDLKEPLKESSLTTDVRRRRENRNTERDWAANDCDVNERERTRIALVTGVMAIANRRGWAHAPPELLIAA